MYHSTVHNPMCSNICNLLPPVLAQSSRTKCGDICDSSTVAVSSLLANATAVICSGVSHFPCGMRQHVLPTFTNLYDRRMRSKKAWKINNQDVVHVHFNKIQNAYD